ncbi:uncharacterized protein PpBr36_05625 [Pyricularia pennisetigena]|uniref:uncharacterized protein n=1 Tax=Pyricularia pennisetigena TaxID=1578925 RepID=UPI00114E9C88|nr:uncharacterized protein PpBr36_05625 [Pyricularia pennisetigena]TLS23650.1 hypothetical protein PpBr36_05625 [Pyricularia pennisetigena]
MEPPSKRPRLSQSLDQDGDELDLNIEDLALDRQFQRSTYRSAFSFKSTLENIFEKYGRDFGDEGDEIDLNTGKITVDRGHFRGIFGDNLPVAVGDNGADVAGQGDEEGEEVGDDDDGIDLNDLYSDAEEDDDQEENEHEEGSIDLEADEDDEGEASRILPLDAIPDLPEIPEPPQLPPSFSALESSVKGGPSTSSTLLGTLNRLLTMAAASRGAADPSFDPLSVTNELVEPAWRVPALPPSLLQRKPTGPVKTKSSAALKSIVCKSRPRSNHDTDSEDEITTRASHIGPERTPSNQRNVSSHELQTRSATSPENTGCTERVPNQESQTRPTSRSAKPKHREPYSAAALKSPPPTEDERDVIESHCLEADDSQRPLKRKHETIVINIIDERLQKLEQSKILLNPPVEAPRPVRQGASSRDESVIESCPKVLENSENSNRPQERTDEGFLETSTESAKQIPGQASTADETARVSPRLPLETERGPTKQTEVPPETFTQNYVDPSYGFSDEEYGGWVPAPKAAGRGRRRGPLILRPRSLSPELGSPPRPARSPLTMPEPVVVSADVTLSSQSLSCTEPDAEKEPRPEQPLVEDAEHQSTPPPADEDERLSILMENQVPEVAPTPKPTILPSVAVEEGEASQSWEPSRLRRSVDEPTLEENFCPANEQYVEQVSELHLEMEQQSSTDSSLNQPEISPRHLVVPQNQPSPKSSAQSLPAQRGDKRSSNKQGSAYLPRRTRRQWPPRGSVPDEVLPSQDPRPATPSPSAAPTPSGRSVRSVGSLLSLINDGSDEDELSTYFTPRTRSVASSGGYAGPARLSRETLSSPIKKKTPKSLSRRLFMTKASSSAHAKPKPSSFSLLSGAQFHTTPLTHRGRGPGSRSSSSVRSRLNSSPVRSVVQTPGGSKRRCGEEGFRCDRDWCFFCIGDQQ